MEVSTERDALEWCAKYLPAITRIAARSLSRRERPRLKDELVSHLIEKVPRLYANWDCLHGASLWCYVRGSLVWHAKKWCAKRATYGLSMRKSESDHAEENPILYVLCASYDAISNIEHSEELLYFIGSLSDYDKLLLVMRHVECLTYTEIARRAGMTVSTARAHCCRALENARQRIHESCV